MKKWTPEICYEESSENSLTRGIPFIEVPCDRNMPAVLFMYESRKIQEEDLEREITLHSYANMLQLKNSLDRKTYDQVREALGLKKLEEASALGEEINKKINDKLSVN